ncbi:MAG: hypothetical protein KAU62_01995, partial [Candidatus Heimdallarchaeota archaeon]|nr:hypothetical protein [Candidatus Heimdallarchaeota archaeon]MCK4609905.1 hypothetical protein [Candidatus Heimdallarchaeota archaeon]
TINLIPITIIKSECPASRFKILLIIFLSIFHRYVQHLIEFDFVALYGKCVAMDKPLTEKLFARTAKFFFVDSYYDKIVCEEPNCIESLSDPLGLIYDVHAPEKKHLEEFTALLKDSFKKVTKILFKEKPDEFVQKVEKLSLKEITDVIQTLSIIELVRNSKNYSKLLSCLDKK